VSDSKRLTTLKRLTTFLINEITVANGYKHDLDETRVRRGKMVFTATEPLPMVSINESPNPDRFPTRAGEHAGNGVQKDKWTLLVQGWVEDDVDNPTDPAYELMADVKKALAKLVACDGRTGDPIDPTNFNLGGVIAGLEYEPGTARAPEQASDKAFFWMRVILSFVEDKNDPYKL
jgi:hypothetical protein